MEAVHILVGVDALDDRVFVQVARQRELDQDAVEPGVPVQLVDQAQEVGLGHVRGHVENLGEKAGFLTRPAFVPYIDAGSWIIAHEDGGQTWSGSSGSDEIGHAGSNLSAEVGGDFVAFEDARGHRIYPVGPTRSKMYRRTGKSKPARTFSPLSDSGSSSTSGFGSPAR